jgi:hypothetical protein
MLSPIDSRSSSDAPRLAASMIDGPPPEQTTKCFFPSSSQAQRLASRASSRATS